MVGTPIPPLMLCIKQPTPPLLRCVWQLVHQQQALWPYVMVLNMILFGPKVVMTIMNVASLSQMSITKLFISILVVVAAMLLALALCSLTPWTAPWQPAPDLQTSQPLQYIPIRLN